MSIDNFGHKLVSWYGKSHRDLPWRNTRDAYRIWLSEIILQQTRVAQGYPYYTKFIARYPDVLSLAAASEKEVLTLWQGLGYYSRARNMLATARTIAARHEGKFPETYSELIKLKGVGDYTASAIASFAFDEQTAVVDGNVFRVLARYYGIDDDIASPASRKIFKEYAKSAIPPGQAAVFNQAIMEFGALQCAPASPKCNECVVNNSCYAFHHNAQGLLPVKTKKNKIRERHIHYVVITFEDKIAMTERTGKDIWKGLYDFLSTETRALPDWKTLLLPELLAHMTPKHSSGPVRHLLSHQLLFLNFWKLELPSHLGLPPNLNWYTREELKDLPKPLPINLYLKDFFVTL